METSAENFPLNITVLGAGAIGSLWANYLHNAGHNVNLWRRDANLSSQRITIDNAAAVDFSVNDQQALSQTDIVLITVKAWQVKNAILPLQSMLHHDTILLFMHNGMGAVEQIDTAFQHHPIVLATTTHASLKKGQNHFSHTGKGITHLGGHNDKGAQCQFLQAVLQHALPEVTWNEDIRQRLWQKLVVNCAINPLTAIEKCNNGALAKEKYRHTVTTIVKEASSVIKAEKIDIDTDTLLKTVYQVIDATSENYSSMQQDVQNHRTTEIEHITGHLCRTAKKHQLNVATNLSLYNKIKQLESCGEHHEP